MASPTQSIGSIGQILWSGSSSSKEPQIGNTYTEPFRTVCCLAALPYLKEGSRLEFVDGIPDISVPGWSQTATRSLSSAGRAQHHILYPSLRKALEVYKPWEHEERQVLFLLAAEGIERLAKYYSDVSEDINHGLLLFLMADCVKKRAVNGEYEMPAFRFAGDECTNNLYSDDLLDQTLAKIWTEERITHVCQCAKAMRDDPVHTGHMLLDNLAKDTTTPSITKALKEAIIRA